MFPSFRTRLVLANAAILSLAVIGIAWLSLASLRFGVNSTIDRMLETLAHGAASARAEIRMGAPLPGFLPPLARVRLNALAERSGVAPGAPPTMADATGANAGTLSPPIVRLTDLDGDPLPSGAGEAIDPAAVRAALAGKFGHTTLFRDGKRYRSYTTALHRGNTRIGTVQVSRALSDFDYVYRSHTQRMLILAPAGLLTIWLLSLFLANQALRPVRRVTLAAAEIGANDLCRRLEVQGKDELGELARTFNEMIARLHAAFEQQRQFTADASHELRTPLARMKLTLSEALSQGTTLEELQEALRVADAAADRLGSLAEDLLILTRSDSGQLPLRLRRMDLCALVRDAAALWEDAGPDVRVELPETPMPIQADPIYLHRVLDNLLQNAVRHTPPSGSIAISVYPAPGAAALCVRDTGEGIPEECLSRVCERFYQVQTARSPMTDVARSSRGGSGLGLAIVRSLVEAHGGRFELTSKVGVGTEAVLVLPEVQPGILTNS